ncbi:MAG: lysophospholipase [Erysipelotrichales bacterium]|nr:lysophospholipase [Erysipelotrichales bacterium]
MKTSNFRFTSKEGTEIFTYKFEPEEGTKIRGVVQIIHGMVEHAKRYERFAKALTNDGYIVYAHDQRGHGLTAGSPEKVGHLADSKGFYWLVEDAHQLTEIIRRNHPELPVFLFGHSMGSFESQRYIELYGKGLKGVVLSGSSGNSPLYFFGKLAAGMELKKQGPTARSPKLNNLSFGAYNKNFEPRRTDSDWLSRDNAEVDKYINDPYCGVVCTTEFYYDFMDGMTELHKKANVAKVPKDLPVLIVSGDMDPVGSNGKGVKKLYETYIGQGLKDVTMKLYPGARHEILNETNRDEVTADILQWIDAHNE